MEREYKDRDEVLRAIADLKGRFPAHSLKPTMLQELEDLEELLDQFPAQKLNSGKSEARVKSDHD